MYRLPRPFSLRQISIPRQRPLSHHPRIQQRWKSQIVYRADGEPLRYQAVRIKKPPISFRRLVTIGLYLGVIYTYVKMVWSQMDIEIEYVEDEEAVQTQEGEEDAEDMVEQIEGPLYADEESTFIPLTWSKEMPRTFYRGSDPEWQEFIKISKDSDRRKKIQGELVQIVHTGSTQNPGIARHLGQDVKVGHYWLDVSFPDGPPPHYERQGIEIGDGYIAWSTQKVDPEKQWRTERALMPTAAAKSVWRTTKVLAGIQWRRMQQQLGIAQVDPSSPEERVRSMLERREDKQQHGREVQKGTEGSTVPSGASAASSSATEKKGDRPWHLPSVPLPSPAASSSVDLPIAMHVFSSTMSKNWNPKKMEPPRGTVMVQGMVEVRGTKGRILFDVQSCYDPRASKFTHVNAGVRSYKRWKQGPKGGP